MPVNPQLIAGLANQPGAGQAFMESFKGTKTNRLFGSALRGEAGALDELAQFNPQVAVQLQKQMQESRLKEAQRLKAEAEKEKAKAEILSQKQEVFDNFFTTTATRLEGVDNVEDAQKLLLPLETDFYKSFKEVHGVDLEPLFGPPGELTEEEWASFKGAEEDRLPGDFKTYQFKGTDQTVTLNEADPEDQKFLQENREKLVPAPTRQETGEPGAFGGDKKLLRDLANSEMSTRNAIKQTQRLRDLLADDPDALTATGRAISISRAIANEAEAVARTFGVEIPEGLNDAARYVSTFEELGVDNARARGMLTNLAYAAAAASGQEGRAVSDRDVKRFLERIGGGYLDPQARVALLDDFAEEIADQFKIRRSVTLGPDAEPYQGDLGLRKTAQPAQFQEGQFYRQGGVTYKFTNGEMVAQ